MRTELLYILLLQFVEIVSLLNKIKRRVPVAQVLLLYLVQYRPANKKVPNKNIMLTLEER